MAQALYRKYRSKKFDEVIGQDHVIETLKKAVKSGRISHAYLFTGPRGVGKTSVARILAHEVNNLPHEGEAAHLDIIEIDAASNRRIDEIRDLRERVHIAPAAAKYKVYIIDEVHMLTKEAFNALLKTLEEPPAHVIFILATTEAHKLPETIISRTQRFSFKPVGSQVIASHLEHLADQEKIKVTKSALELIADHAEGSVRDSVSLLDQLAASGKTLDERFVRAALGVPQLESLSNMIAHIKSGQSHGLINDLDEMREQGINPAIAAKELSAKLRQQLAQGDASAWLPKLLRQLLEISSSTSPYDELEISLLEAAASNARKAGHEEIKQAHADVQPPKATLIKAQPIKKAAFSSESWGEALLELKNEAGSFYKALRLARPTLEGNKLTLAFEFPLHQKKASEIKCKQLLAEVIEKITGQKLKIECVVDKSFFKTTRKEVTANNSQKDQPSHPLEAISNIFGAAEVLES